MKIQKHVRRYEARKAYKKLHVCALTLQTGLRAMAAHKEFRYRKQTKAAIIIQVLSLITSYLLESYIFTHLIIKASFFM